MGEQAENIAFYTEQYRDSGFNAQRRWPNEDLIRFFGLNFFHLPFEERKKIKVLETGSGPGSNLWPLAREGFDVYGLELSEHAVALCEQMFSHWGVTGHITQGNMMEMPYEDAYFDIIFETLSACCLNEEEFKTYIKEVERVLKPGGYFYSFHPSKNSQAFLNHAPAQKIDDSTLDGICRPGSPYEGYTAPFRFISRIEFMDILKAEHFDIDACEVHGRTYRNSEEYHEYISMVARKRPFETKK